jgi:hypothetical protein
LLNAQYVRKDNAFLYSYLTSRNLPVAEAVGAVWFC